MLQKYSQTKKYCALALTIVMAISVFTPASTISYAQVNATADVFAVVEGSQVSASVGTNDTSSVPNPILYGTPGGSAVVLQTTPSGLSTGSIVLDANFANNGSFVYTSPTDVTTNYAVYFQYTAYDSDGSVVTQTVTFQITPNQAPVAVTDNVITDEDTDGIGNVLTNDSDPDSQPDPLSATIATQPTNGSVVLNSNGSFVYTPNTNYNGADSFTYTVSDGVDSAVGTVNITVNAVNDAPSAVADNYSTDEDVVLEVVAPGVLSNDIDVDVNTLTAATVTTTTNGTLVLNSNGSFVYTPNANYKGNDSFTYQISDGVLTSAPVTVTIIVNNLNDLPVAVDDGVLTVNEDEVLIITPDSLLANDSDIDGDTLSLESFTQPTNGTVIFNNNNLEYLPDPNYSGLDSFTYTMSDGNGGTATATVSLEVTPVNDLPIVIFDSVGDTVFEGESITVSGVIIDPDGDDIVSATFYPADETYTNINFVPTATGTPGEYSFIFSRYVNDDNPTGTPFDRIYPIVYATDSFGDEGYNIAYYDLYNVAPTIANSTAPATSATVNTDVNLNFDFSDPGADDTKYILINWGDNTSENLTITPDFTTTEYLNNTYSHKYTAAGNYTITITISDDDLGVTTMQYPITITQVVNTAVTVNEVVDTKVTVNTTETNNTKTLSQTGAELNSTTLLGASTLSMAGVLAFFIPKRKKQ